jgi:hypothetical protein
MELAQIRGNSLALVLDMLNLKFLMPGSFFVTLFVGFFVIRLDVQ